MLLNIPQSLNFNNIYTTSSNILKRFDLDTNFIPYKEVWYPEIFNFYSILQHKFSLDEINFIYNYANAYRGMPKSIEIILDYLNAEYSYTYNLNTFTLDFKLEEIATLDFSLFKRSFIALIMDLLFINEGGFSVGDPPTIQDPNIPIEFENLLIRLDLENNSNIYGRVIIYEKLEIKEFRIYEN